MKVSELVAALQELPPDVVVLIWEGYEADWRRVPVADISWSFRDGNKRFLTLEGQCDW